MKYFVLIPDGAADYNIEKLGGKTPFEVANKPTIDKFASKSIVGTVSNVPQGMVPESDTANLAILSYNPSIYSKGRSPLEAVSMGLTMRDNDIAFRCNVITVSDDEAFEKRKILDHSADEITTAEAAELIKAVGEKLGTADRRFYPGVSYRHCMLWENPPKYPDFARPHDNIGNEIGGVLPPEPYRSLIKESYDILKSHPVNLDRIKRGLKPANSIWLWSPGGKPCLPAFNEKWGIEGTVVSAVDLIKGIGLCAGMKSIDVEGATGNWKTNYDGKAQAAIDAFKNGSDLVYVHVEAPDECGHRAELENKITCIGDISEKIMKPVTEYLERTGEKYAVMCLPDHPTPICKRTHTMDPVPFMIYKSWENHDGVKSFNEKSANEKNYYIPDGSTLMSLLIDGE